MTVYEKSRRDIGVLEGALNVNVLRPGPTDNGTTTNLLWRFPKRNTSIWSSIAYEYNTIGFTGHHGTVRRRSPQEQTQFTQYCASHGLRVIPPYLDGDTHVKNIFLSDAETLDVYLAHATEHQAARVVHDLYSDMMRAHSHDIVYGDRWSENMLIRPHGGLLHIDFDLEIGGPTAKEFEAAQAAYYVLAGARGKIITTLARFLAAPHARWDLDKIEQYLVGHAIHFNKNKKYGGLADEVNTLVALMHNERKAQK